MIKRIQNTIIQAITDAINLMLIDKELDSYVNEFTIHMLPPTTQEEIDRRDNLSGKVQLTSDIMNMLSDIEDIPTKLKILKNLLSNVIDDVDIINIIQEQIDKLESEMDTESSEEDIVADESGDIDGDITSSETMDFNDTFGSDLGSDDTESEESGEETSSESDLLPSGDDLGVDLTSDEE